MYTVYDFINNDISSKHMRFGWKVETKDNSRFPRIILRYIMLNFDWNSLQFLNDEVWNMFLNSKSYENMKKRIDTAENKFKRTYFEASSIDNLKWMVKNENLKIDIEKLVSHTIAKKSEEMKQKIENPKEQVA